MIEEMGKVALASLKSEDVQLSPGIDLDKLLGDKEVSETVSKYRK